MLNRTFTRAFVGQDTCLKVAKKSDTEFDVVIPALTTVSIREEVGDKAYCKFSMPNGKYINGWIDRDRLLADLNDRVNIK